MLDQPGQIGCVLSQSFHYGVAECVALRIPIAILQLERSELHVDRHHVLARWRERRVGDCRNRRFEVRLDRELAVL